MVLVAEGLTVGMDGRDGEDAAFSALTPSQGAPPACASLPRNRSSLADKAARRACNHRARLRGVCFAVHHHGHVDIVKSAFRDELLLTAEILYFARAPQPGPPADLNVFSAGAASRHTLPARLSATARRPTAQPSMEASWALCPQAWAAPVALSANGWPGLSTASSSPITATRGPAPRQSQPFTPVRAGRVTSVRPSEAKASSTFPAVRVSL